VPDFRAGLKEMLRVLRRAGAPVCSSSRPPVETLVDVYNYYFFNILPRIGGLITGARRPTAT